MAEEKFEIIEDPDKISEIKAQGFDLVLESVIGRAWGNLDKGFKAYLPVPKTDEQAQERYNCSLEDLIAEGVKKFFTQVGYEAGVIATDKSGKAITLEINGKPVKQFRQDLSDEEIQREIQTMADGFQVNVRKPGKSANDKATLSQLDKMAADAGMDREAFLAMLKSKHIG